MSESPFHRQVEAVRRFNRFYTQKIGVLNQGMLDSPFSLTEVRVLYELAHRENPSAAELARELGLDAGYLSRILRAFEKKRLIAKALSASDGRQSILSLTKRGQDAFSSLNLRSHEGIALLLRKLDGTQQRQLMDALRTVEVLLGDAQDAPLSYLLRSHRPGDMGWIVHRHGALYAEEYGWDERFEALVAKIAARFIEHFDPKREHCWVAEIDNEIVGSVFLVKKSQTVAQLRLLLVEPRARGLGIGKRLVAECIRFARQAGYRKLVLWTNDILHAARHIYEAAGFRLIEEEPHHSFGHDLVGQTWELKL